MKEPIKKETVIVMVMMMACVVLVVLVVFLDPTPDGPMGSVPVRTETDDDYEQDWDTYASEESFDQPSGYKSSGGRSAGSGTALNREQLTTAGLVGELKRIVRAGRRLDALRNNNNLTFTRRCLETSEKLEADLSAVQSTGLNVPFPSSTTSLQEILQQASICISCSSEARTFCVMAETGLRSVAN